MRRLKKETKVYPGGLVAVNDFEDVDVPEAITRMIKAKLSVESFGSEEQRQEAEQIIEVLKSTPRSLEEYVQRLTIYNQFSYAHDEIESKRNILGKCVFESVKGKPLIHCAKINPASIEKYDLKTGLHLICYPVGWSGRVISVKIVNVDLAKGHVFVVLADKVPEINLSQPYKLFLATSPFNFCTRHRVLTSIIADIQHNIVFPQLPKDMIPVNEYLKQKAKDLKTMKFSLEKRLNYLQRSAIIGIMRASPSIPYILFGPPGTGKTTTLVEAVVQLLKLSTTNKVLVCTPSNTAADLFALALLKTGAVDQKFVLRMFSMCKPVKEQNDNLKAIARVVKDRDGFLIFGFEPKKQIQKQYRVIVSTLSASSYLVSGGLKGNFSHIIVDEAGQADELDTLIPIVGLADKNTRVVLAGDPKQLGPMESIEMLRRFKMNTSLLERYINSSCYTNQCRLMTMLQNNYRSYALLVKTPSKLFYDGRLIASAVQSQKSTLCNWSGLPIKNVPLIFHSVSDVEEKEEKGFSYRNIKEVELVVDYVNRILSETNVKPEEIGIISPYKYQVKTLREKLSRLPEMVIDSVERFQGSERRVIIISTVRNKCLGFLDCDKRINTTITRAQELMVIVGNHKNLSKSKSWKKVIEFCQDKKALIGDLDSPLEVVHKKKRNKFLKKKKNQPVLLEENKQKKIDDLDKSSLNASNQTRSKVTIKQVSQQNQVNYKKKVKKLTARSKGFKSLKNHFELINLNAN